MLASFTDCDDQMEPVDVPEPNAGLSDFSVDNDADKCGKTAPKPVDLHRPEFEAGLNLDSSALAKQPCWIERAPDRHFANSSHVISRKWVPLTADSG